MRVTLTRFLFETLRSLKRVWISPGDLDNAGFSVLKPADLNLFAPTEER